MQEVLTDAPRLSAGNFETVIQEILETKMIQHIGTAPYQHNFLVPIGATHWEPATSIHIFLSAH